MHNYANIPDLSGKVAIVSGANSGTGYGISYHLAKHGCHVIMASRRKAKLEQAKQQLLVELPRSSLSLEVLDLTNKASITDFSNRIKAQYKKIDFLANNAGAGHHSYVETEDGLEENLTINYLGHFMLTTLLMPVLLDGSRIVNFSSIGYKMLLKHELDVDNLMCTDAKQYNQMQEYCKAKLCAILHAFKLQQQFEKHGISSKAFACHPGNARTSLMDKDHNTWPIRLAFRFVLGPLMKVTGMSQSLYDGALPAIEALIADDAQTGMVYAPSKREATGAPKAFPIDTTHFVDSDIDALWDKTQQLLQLRVEDYLLPSKS